MAKTKAKKLTKSKPKTTKAKLTKELKKTPKKTVAKKAIAVSTPKISKSKLVDQKKLENYTKQDLIEEFAQRSGDTGSPEVQVAIATQKIYKLSSHLEENPKDNHSRRGLLKIIAKRRRLLSYLQNKDESRYHGLIGHLGLKK